MTSTARHLLTGCGVVLLGLGALGLVLPLLPTTPFMIAAAGCFSRASPRFESWLLNNPRLGPSITAWRRGRAIPVRAKTVAVMAMAASYAAVFAAAAAPPAALVALAAALGLCAGYILTRPSR